MDIYTQLNCSTDMSSSRALASAMALCTNVVSATAQNAAHTHTRANRRENDEIEKENGKKLVRTSHTRNQVDRPFL